jgi:hypothetical protein
MRNPGIGNRLRVTLVTAVVAAVGLVAATNGVAAPRDNVANARKCVRVPGWQTLQTTTGRTFRGPFDCILYALRGGVLSPIAPPPPVETPPPPAE